MLTVGQPELASGMPSSLKGSSGESPSLWLLADGGQDDCPVLHELYMRNFKGKSSYDHVQLCIRYVCNCYFNKSPPMKYNYFIEVAIQ